MVAAVGFRSQCSIIIPVQGPNIGNMPAEMGETVI